MQKFLVLLLCAWVVSASAETPTISYSFGNIGGYPWCAASPVNGQTSEANAMAAGEAAYLARFTAYHSGYDPPWQVVSNTLSGSTYPKSGSIIICDSTDCAPSALECVYQIAQISACPTAGWQPYNFAVDDVRCRPAFCATRLGQYFDITLPLGTNGVSATTAPSVAPNAICYEACEGTKEGGLNIGVQISDTEQSWGFSGTYRISGVACVDRTGLATTTATADNWRTTLTSGTGGGSGLTDTQAAVLVDVKTNTAATNTAVGGVKTSVDAVKGAVDGVKDAINGVGGDGGSLEGSAVSAMGDADASVDGLITSLESGNLPDFGGSSSRWRWNPLTALAPGLTPTCHIEKTWQIKYGATVIATVDIGPNYCDFAPYIKGFLAFIIYGATFTYLASLAYKD